MSFVSSFTDSQSNLIPAEWLRSARRGPVHFQDSPWIRKLNEALRYELAAVGIYRALISNRQDALAARIVDFADDHARVARRLATLIIARHGVPTDRPATVMAGLNKSALQICALLPHEISESFCKTRLSVVERYLCSLYARLASEAPESDRAVLDELGKKSADRHFTICAAGRTDRSLHRRYR